MHRLFVEIQVGQFFLHLGKSKGGYNICTYILIYYSLTCSNSHQSCYGTNLQDMTSLIHVMHLQLRTAMPRLKAPFFLVAFSLKAPLPSCWNESHWQSPHPREPPRSTCPGCDPDRAERTQKLGNIWKHNHPLYQQGTSILYRKELCSNTDTSCEHSFLFYVCFCCSHIHHIDHRYVYIQVTFNSIRTINMHDDVFVHSASIPTSAPTYFEGASGRNAQNLSQSENTQ